MTNFIGRGVFKQYSQVINLEKPLIVRDISKLLKFPKELSDNLIVVRQNRKLNDEEIILDCDEIYIFFAAMGG